MMQRRLKVRFAQLALAAVVTLGLIAAAIATLIHFIG